MPNPPISREEFQQHLAAPAPPTAQECDDRAFPEDAVHITTLIDEYDWLTEPQMRGIYLRGEICHWKVGRKILVSRADFKALLNAGLNAALREGQECAR